MTRILLLIPSVSGIGGTERMVSNLGQLLAQDHEVAVCSFDTVGQRPYFDPGTAHFALGPVPDLPLPLRWITYTKQAWRLAGLKRQLSTEVTISNLWRADLISLISGGRDRKIAVCHINIVANPSNRLLLLLRSVIGPLYRRFDKVVAVNQSLLTELRGLYRLDPDKSCFIDNFVSVKEGPATLPPPGRTRLAWCGRFVPEKNVGALIAIFAGLRRTNSRLQLLMIGDGPLMNEARTEALAAGLTVGSSLEDEGTDIVFAGPTSDPLPLVRGATLLLLPSIAEGLPVVLLEALSMGVPVAAADCRGGGVCSLLLDASHHDPTRTETAPSPLGLLLPVPSFDRPASITRWVEDIGTLLRDEAALKSMRDGALRRSRSFSPEAARLRWRDVVASASVPGRAASAP